MRHRLGIYCPGNGVGGPWRYVHSLLRLIDLEEFEVCLFCGLTGQYDPRSSVTVITIPPPAVATVPRDRRQSVLAGVLRNGIRIVPSAARLWRGTYDQARSLAREFSSQDLSLLHTQCTGCEESPIAARLAGIPAVVGTFHVAPNVDVSGSRESLRYRAIEYVSNRCLTRCIGVSVATGDSWISRTRLAPSRVSTIHNGVDPLVFTRSMAKSAARQRLGITDDEQPVIGAIGRLDPVKGFDYLITAVEQLSKTLSRPFVLLIAGDGPSRQVLADQISRAGLNTHVMLLGYQSDVQLIYDALDIAVVSSLCEALPYSLLEAMSNELPVVATSVGGIPEVVVPGETGFLAPPRDPQALANALRPLLESAELRTRLGKAGRERVMKHFTEEECVRKTIDVYREMLQGVGKGNQSRVLTGERA